MNDTLVVGTGVPVADGYDDHHGYTDAYEGDAEYEHEYDDYPRRRRSGVRAVIAAVVVLAIAGAAFAGWWLAAGPGTYSPTPDVIGETFDQATSSLSVDGLALTATAEEYSESVPAGSILATDPVPGDGIRPGGTVEAVVSLGPERYAVPDVRGSTPTEATNAIVTAGLATGGRVEAFDDTVPMGQVARTDPAIGDPVPPDTPIDLVISKGPEPVELPDITGKKQSVATKRLEEAGLQVTATKEFSTSVAEGRVVSMSPKAATVVDSGSTVELVVSKGPPPVEVPNLIDMRRKVAVEELQRLGLKAKIDDGEVTRLNRVFDQTPSPGEMVPRGTTVTLRII
jgi:beta-lactam-binding protein with PASTA domain